MKSLAADNKLGSCLACDIVFNGPQIFLILRALPLPRLSLLLRATFVDRRLVTARLPGKDSVSPDSVTALAPLSSGSQGDLGLFMLMTCQ